MVCLLCGGKTKKYFQYSESYKLVQCCVCDLVQTDPMPTDDFLKDWYQKYDILGEREPYYQALASDDPWSTSEGLDIARQFARIKKEFMAYGLKLMACPEILDIGSGQGLFLDLVKRAGWEGVGIELNEKAVKMSQDRFGIKVQAGTIDSVDLGEKKFDVVALWDIFEHVKDPLELLLKSNQLLKQEGLIFIETPNVSSFLDKIVLLLSKIGITGPAKTFYGLHHLSLWNPKNIKQALEKYGFEIKKIEQDYTPSSRVFRGKTFKDKFMRLAIGLVQMIGGAIGRENKMIIIAKKVISNSRE